ncbi:advillin isoform X2 [Strongylocentrotus purpuratus]|uniref:HP domain-containing protein n=1 Tax=Strongylocentrotus purpuratus TaxID=7668 RepID=A0A7M7N239_STRPU|nr:advillin isoform X2 [Strongylocentrotus purpuratus]
MSKVDPAFSGVGKKEGLKIWRIENLKVVAIPDKSYGQFHKGDSYICLKTNKKGNGFSWNIHFWLGTETSQDEAGVAAYKTVELDDSLGGGPVQFREVESSESAEFMSYFPKGIRYLEGGIKSGFKKVDKDKFEKKMYIVKGKRNIRVNQVPCKWESLNNGDVFIFDLGQHIVVWNGPQSSRTERMQGTQAAKGIRDDERGGKARILFVDDDKLDAETLKVCEAKVALGPRGGIKPQAAKDDDERFSRKQAAQTRLYKVSDESGSLVVTEICSAPLDQTMLNSNDCFIVDQGHCGIFVWKGKGSTKQERKSAFSNAQGFIKAKQYPENTPVTVINENSETIAFKAIFKGWKDPGDTKGLGKTHTTGNIAHVKKEKFDASSLHKIKTSDIDSNPNMASRTGMYDDGSGKIEVFRIENFEAVKQSNELQGQFFGGDSYIVKYTYKQGGRERYIIYYWLGLTSSKDEQGAAAILTTKMDDKLNGAAVQIRVVQGKEPQHFLQLFKGKMIIHLGGCDSGFKHVDENEEAGRSSGFKNQQAEDKKGNRVRMYQVKGTNEYNTRAVEVEVSAKSLNANDIFVIKGPKQLYIWAGKGGSGDERELGKKVAKVLEPKSAYTLVPEEKEPAEFWEAIGGKQEYASSPRLQEETPAHGPRLFQCSNASGNFRVEEINNYTQQDLIQDDVMLLDAYNELYIWVGAGANAEEKKQILGTAKEYLMTDPSGRDPDSTQLIQVKQGFEPVPFTGWFMAWDNKYFQSMQTEDQMRQELAKQNAVVVIDLKAAEEQEDSFENCPKFTLAELQAKEVPEGVVSGKKEKHLSKEDFQKLFGMPYEKYATIPKWKQDNLKKKAGVY